MWRFLIYITLSYVILGCSQASSKEITDPEEFGKDFFTAVKSADSNNLKSFFISNDEINLLYDTLEYLQTSSLDTLRDLKTERKDHLSRRDTVFKHWLDDYISFYESKNIQFNKTVIDSIFYDYVIAKASKDITIPWPNSKKHEPDLFGPHYAKITIRFHDPNSQYDLTILPFYNGKYWKFDCISDFGIIITKK